MDGGVVTKFLIFYFIAYGGAHFYFYRKVVQGVALPPHSKFCLAAFLLLLFIAPLAARALESSGLVRVPELLSNAGYLWMGLLFLFITAAATLDIARLLISAISSGESPGLQLSPRLLLVLAGSYTFIIGIYGYYEATAVRTEKLSLTSSRIPATVKRIRIVQISDLHAGQIVRERRVKAALELVKAASPDIVVSTGDLVDGYQRHLNGLESLFREITPPFGKYAIPGNHEYYVGIERSLTFMKDAGFTVLRNENFDLGGIICLTGVDDSHNKSQRTVNALIEKKLLESAGEGEYRLLLKHRPVVAKESVGRFDLQLSGHVHKGQIFPFNLVTWLSFRVKTGLTVLDTGHYLYVSRGTGVWGPPIRFLAPPEITVIDLLPAGSSEKNI
jgi:predicted MPP superfamily phosphohydrolase